MRAAALGPLLSLVLAACAGSTPADAPLPPFDSALFKHWMHSFEEDTASAKVYRPKGYAFPRARGREGFELQPDGVYIRYDIGRGDGSASLKGTWKQIGPRLIEVRTADGAAASERLQILTYDDKVLTLRK
jgi:hypothetical protein